MTLLLINALFYQSTVFILFCKILACFWLMNLAPSTYLWLFPATFFKPYPREWGQLDPGFLPQRLFGLCVGNFTCHYSLISLLLLPSLSWGSNLELLHTRQVLYHWAAPPAPLLVCLSLGFCWLFLLCKVVCASVSCSELLCAETSECLHVCGWAVFSGLGTCWDSCLSSPVVFCRLFSAAI